MSVTITIWPYKSAKPHFWKNPNIQVWGCWGFGLEGSGQVGHGLEVPNLKVLRLEGSSLKSPGLRGHGMEGLGLQRPAENIQKIRFSDAYRLISKQWVSRS